MNTASEPATDNVHEFPGTLRLQQVGHAAEIYLVRTDMAVAHEDKPYVCEMAVMLREEAGWSSFANAVKSRHAGRTDHPVAKADLSSYLKVLHRAIRAAWKDRERREQRDREANATINDIDGMLDSESPFLVAAGLLLKHRPGRIWWDDFKGCIVTNWYGGDNDAEISAIEVDDRVMLRFREWLMRQRVEVLGGLTQRTSDEAVAFVADKDSRDSLKAHVKGLPEWDGESRLDDWCGRAFGCVADGEGGQTAEYIKAVGRNMLIGMIARAMKPGCKMDLMPIFYGGQGARKSTAMSILGGEGFFEEISESPASKDFYMQIQGVWLGEVAELASIASRKVETAKVKAMLSRQKDKFRPPYGKSMQHYQRRALLAGTTNVQQFMRDETGNRRFPTLRVGAVDLDWLRQNRDQLFAEALKEFRAGASWWEFPQEDHDRVVQAHEVKTAYHDMIADRLCSGDLYDGTETGPKLVAYDYSLPTTGSDRWGNAVTTLRVGVEWLGLLVEQAEREQPKIVATLQRLGWCSKETKGKTAAGHRKSVNVWVPVDLDGRAKARKAGELVLGRMEEALEVLF